MPKFAVPGVERVLYWPYNEALPELRNGSNLMAPSSFDIMEARTTKRRMTKYSREMLMWGNYATVDALISYKGRVVIRLDASYLMEITPKGKSKRGAIEIDTGIFENIAGVEFIIGEMQLNADLTPDEARMDPIWQVLARGNQDVLDAYVEAVFGELDKQGIEKGMRIAFSDAIQNIPRMKYVELTGSRENFSMNGSTKVGDRTTVLGFKETRQRDERRRSLDYTVLEHALG